ncbi:hypothetical protein GCM10010387_04580 [Streptomyces inusitatus]|uniref:Uncharacterized protein n=1 Tax=Streptomyces inusitatus TaxID=68221 RepID=A0A918PLL4_9ACTN|nr:hypothetical protein [Streptomyces inusitatus]GGZ15342.1 hypothetical protein GCM10010387_04580 [Streptomyces inusitatus]
MSEQRSTAPEYPDRGHSTPMTVVVEPGTPPPPVTPAQPEPGAAEPTASTVTPPYGTEIPKEGEPV